MGVVKNLAPNCAVTHVAIPQIIMSGTHYVQGARTPRFKVRTRANSMAPHF